VRIARARTRRIVIAYLLCILAAVPACGSSAPSNGQSPAQPEPCTLLTRPIAAQISGDARVTNQATNVAEMESGYVACIYADATNEANSVAVQIKSAPGRVTPAALQAAAAFFSAGEPVQPFQPFPVVGIGDDAIGASTPGVAFIVFSHGGALVFVGADSTSRSASSLQAGVETLARRVAAAI